MNDPDIEMLSTTVPAALARAVRELLESTCDRGLRLAVAESCTGGLLSSLLTDVPGCSHAFERGFIVYSSRSKEELLGVPRGILDRHGAVSEKTAIALAEGALARSSADVTVAITGYAGPAGRSGEPGLVHFASASRFADTSHRVERFGDIGRGAVRLAATRVAVDMLSATVAIRQR